MKPDKALLIRFQAALTLSQDMREKQKGCVTIATASLAALASLLNNNCLVGGYP